MVDISRRGFISSVGITIAAGGLSALSITEAMAQPIERIAENVPTTILGRTGWKSKIIGLGTIFRKDGPNGWMTPGESEYLLDMMVDLGINVFELGFVYKDSMDWMGRVVPKHRRDKMFLSAKSTRITKKDFLIELDETLKKLKTDHVDNFMLHNYSSFVEYERVMGEDGAFGALKEAQKAGKTKFIGITSHGCPAMMSALRSGEFDVFLLPYNAASREFDRALNLAAKLNVGMLVMKPFGGNGLLKYNPKNPRQLPQTLTPEECLRYVLSHPGVKVPVPNMGNPKQLKQALATAATFRPLTPEERREIEAKADRIVGGVCSECKGKPCEEICQNQVPISHIISSAQALSRLSYDSRRHGDMYAALSHDFWDCDRCGECEKVCPKKFPIREDMEKFDKKNSESRARAIEHFNKVYRYL